jgi:Glycine zipper
MQNRIYTLLISSFCLLSATTNTYALDIFAYPTGGQSVEQQQKDQFECHQWSVSQTGFDPNRPQQQNYAYSPSQGSYQSGGALDFGDADAGHGGLARDGARGAAMGAIGGAIAGDAGQGAAIGAVAGALFGGVRRSNRKAEQQRWEQQQAQQAQMQMQQQQQQQQQARSNFNRAYSACMTSRDYKVQ